MDTVELTKRLEAQGKELAAQKEQIHKQQEAIKALADHLGQLNGAIKIVTAMLEGFNNKI